MDTLALLRSWLRRSRRRRLPPGASHLAKQLARHVRLRLETLEDRVPPVDLFGFMGGIWEDPFANPYVDPDTGMEEPRDGLTPTMELTLTADPDDPYRFPSFSFPPMGDVTLLAGPGWTVNDDGDLVFTAGIAFGEPEIAVPVHPEPGHPGFNPDLGASPDPGSVFNPGTPPPQIPGGGGPNQPGDPVAPGWASITRITDSQGREVTGLTNDPNLTVSGIAPAGAEVTVAVDGAAQGTVRADGEGNWGLALPNALTEGAHAISARLGTQAGETFDVFVDTTRPQLTFTAPSHSPLEESPQVTVTAGDNVGLEGPVVIDIDLNRDGDFTDAGEPAFTTVPDGEGTQTFNLNPLPRGNYALRARATDAAGNVGVSASTIVRRPIIYTTPPGPLDPEGTGETEGGTDGGSDGGVAAFDGSGSGKEGSGDKSFRQLVTGNETEPNDTPGQANQFNITPNDPLQISGTVGSNTDEDYFEFTLGGRAGVFFDVDSRETGLSTTLNSVLTLFDGNNNQLQQNDNGFDFDTGLPAQQTDADANSADSALYADLAAGTYRVRVSSTGNTSGDYTLTIDARDTYTTTVPVFESLAGAADTFYLDFDGHSATDAWGTYTIPRFNLTDPGFDGNANEYSPAELKAIENIFRVMAEDFSPFNVNVSTQDPGTFADGVALRMNFGGLPSAIGQGNQVLGIAFLDSYAGGGNTDNVAHTFTENFGSYGTATSYAIMARGVLIGHTASHEYGHTLGLEHYGGSNSQPLGLMEEVLNGLGQQIWRTGQTTNSGGQTPMFQDDMAIISNTTNTFGYRADDHGNTPATATVLSPSGNVYTANGIISDLNTDVADVFRFTATSGGNTMIRVEVDDYLNNLDVEIQLLDAAGSVVASDAPTNSFDASADVALTDADYFLVVSSDAEPGEAGQYTVTIETPMPPPPPPEPPPGDGGGGGGGGGGQTFEGDVFEPNQTSDQAHSFGVLNVGSPISATNLTIANTAQGLPDYDWYRFTAGQTGTLTASMVVTSGGTLELHVFQLNGSTPVEVAEGQGRPGVPVNLFVPVAAGRTYYIHVKGRNSSFGVLDQGRYNLGLQM